MAKPVNFGRLRVATCGLALFLGASVALATPGDDSKADAKTLSEAAESAHRLEYAALVVAVSVTAKPHLVIEAE